MDGIACTYGPGLVGALLVGVSYAKALSYAANKPLIGVNHIQGHIAANYITYKRLKTTIFNIINIRRKHSTCFSKRLHRV